MSTLVIIPNCDYATFEAIRDEILDKQPFALMNDIYASKRFEAHFFFHDIKYIPDELKPYIMHVPIKDVCDFSNIRLPEVK